MSVTVFVAAVAGSVALSCGGSGGDGGTAKACAREVLAAAPAGFYSTTYAISDRIENCSTEDEQLIVEFSFTHDSSPAGAACPGDPPAQSVKSNILAGSSSNISISAAMPNCPGAKFSVTADASAGGTRLASSTVPLAAPSSGGGASKTGGATSSAGASKSGGGADNASPHPSPRP
jgi:hypothetical protein